MTQPNLIETTTSLLVRVVLPCLPSVMDAVAGRKTTSPLFQEIKVATATSGVIGTAAGISVVVPGGLTHLVSGAITGEPGNNITDFFPDMDNGLSKDITYVFLCLLIIAAVTIIFKAVTAEIAVQRVKSIARKQDERKYSEGENVVDKPPKRKTADSIPSGSGVTYGILGDTGVNIGKTIANLVNTLFSSPLQYNAVNSNKESTPPTSRRSLTPQDSKDDAAAQEGEDAAAISSPGRSKNN